MILAFLNNKGGVGKTSSAVNFADEVARRGFKTLLVDLDSQSSASFSMGIRREDLEPGMGGVLIDDMPLREVIRKGVRPNLDLVSAEMRLASFDNLINPEDPKKMQYLQEALAPVKEEYAMIVLDGAPGFTLLTSNIVVACDRYIVPVTASYLAMQGLRNMVEAVELIGGAAQTEPKRLGILLTVYDQRKRIEREVVELLRSVFGKEVFEQPIPTNVRVAEAPSHGKTIFEWDPLSSGAAAYRLFVDEVLERVGLREGAWRRGVEETRPREGEVTA